MSETLAIRMRNLCPLSGWVMVVLLCASLCCFRNVIAQGNWRPENYGTYAGAFNSVVVTPTGRLIAGSVWDGFFISDDQGDSWISSNNGFAGIDNRQPILHVIGTQIFAGSIAGLFVSTDDGDSWSSAGIAGKLVRNIISSGPNIVIAAVDGNYYSVDNAFTWIPVNGMSYSNIAAFTHLGSTLFAVGDNKVFKSEDDGASWTETTSIYPTPLFSSDIITSGSALICATNIGVFRSTDAGATWQLMDSSKRYGKMKIINGSVFLGTDNTIFKSNDDGATWEQSDPSLITSTVMQFAESSGDIFVATAKGGMLFSDDDGASWSNKVFGMVRPHINSLAAVGTTFIAATNSGLHISTDNTSTWNLIPGTASRRYTGIVAADNRLIAGTDANGIFISTDNGLTWSNSNNGLTNIQVKSLAMVESRLFCGTQGGLFYSDNLGNSWSSGGLNGVVSAISGKNIYLYASVEQQGMMVSISANNNLQWSSASSGLPASSEPPGPTMKWMTTLGNKVYYADAANNKIYQANLGSKSWTVYKNTDGNGLTTDGTNLYYGSSIKEIIANTGLSTASLGYPNHLIFDRARFILPFNDRLYACFNSNMYTGPPEAGVIYSTHIAGIPGISAYNPPTGKVGDTITITGINLGAVPKRVFFNDLEGTILSASPTSWTVTLPPTGGNATVKIVVGSLTAVLSEKFSIIPVLKRIIPNEARVGARITIEGSGLDPSANYFVNYGFNPGSSVKPNTTERLSLEIPNISGYKGPITLLLNGVGLQTNEDIIILPHVTDYTPKHISPGTIVYIHGSGFGTQPGTNKVTFSGIEAFSIIQNTKNLLHAIAPIALTPGLIAVTTHDRTSVFEIPYSTSVPTDCSWGPPQPFITQAGLYNGIFPILSSSSEGGNTWYWEGEQIENTNGKYIVATRNGAYTLKVIVDGCPSPISTPFNVNILVTGLPDDEPTNSLEIYPNPFEAELLVNIMAIPESEWVDVSIINQLGVHIFRQKIPGGAIRQIRTDHLSPGLYFIRAETPKMYFDKKMIKR